MDLAAAVLSGFALAPLAPWLCRVARGATGWLLALLPVGLMCYFVREMPNIAAGDTLRVSQPWMPTLGADLSLQLDGLSLLFALLITGIGALIIVYAGGYLAGHRHLGRLYAFLLMFMASMLGLVLADNMIVLFVFWELTGLSSYFLIGFDHHRSEARAAALQALLVTGGGGLALLAGLLLLGQAGGSLELSVLAGQGSGSDLRTHPLYWPALLLILLGAFTKSAQFPFHFWLPGAMQAPTPVSAYLHSATMVKAGVYLLARMSPILGGTPAWTFSLLLAGGATMLIGTYLALQQTDLKRILAYSTVSALGTLIFLLAPGTELAVKAAIVFLVVHSLYKGALFLVAGALDHETGTRDIRRLGGLWKSMPLTAIAGVLAALSMAGLPPLFGFVGKELLYETTWTAPDYGYLLTLAAVLANMILFAVAMIAGIRPFFGRMEHPPTHAHEAPPAIWLGPLMLGVLGAVIGLFPQLIERLVAAAAGAVLHQTVEVELALWHGVNPMLMLSGLTVAGGVAIFAGQGPLLRMMRRLEFLSSWGPERWYELSLRGLNALAAAQTRILQNGILGLYLVTILVTLGILVGVALVRQAPAFNFAGWSDFHPFELMVAVLILAAASLAITVNSRLTAVAAMGAVGYGVAIIFLLFGAPDLAMTQLAIETLTVVVFLLVLHRLPRFARLSTALERWRDAAVALLGGAVMTVLVLTATSSPLQSRLAPYYAENSLTAAKGRNLVNVILVDFRALDTLGEIIVLAIAATGVYGLLRLRLEPQEPAP